MVECVVWESNAMVRYRQAVSCARILGMKLSAGEEWEHKAIKNIWLSFIWENWYRLVSFCWSLQKQIFLSGTRVLVS